MRISLTNLALLIAVIALLLTVFLLARERGPLIEQNKRLNEERGSLVVRDRSKLHAIKIPEGFAGNAGTFRVFIPDGASYVAIASVNDVPKTGVPEIAWSDLRMSAELSTTRRRGYAKLRPGEHVISLWVDDASGDPTVRFARGNTIQHRIRVSDEEWPCSRIGGRVTNQTGVFDTTVVASQGTALILLRQRVYAVDKKHLSYTGRIPEPDGPQDGLLLWIQPEPVD